MLRLSIHSDLWRQELLKPCIQSDMRRQNLLKLSIHSDLWRHKLLSLRARYDLRRQQVLGCSVQLLPQISGVRCRWGLFYSCRCLLWPASRVACQLQAAACSTYLLSTNYGHEAKMRQQIHQNFGETDLLSDWMCFANVCTAASFSLWLVAFQEHSAK